jgi:hypothetical protein
MILSERAKCCNNGERVMAGRRLMLRVYVISLCSVLVGLAGIGVSVGSEEARPHSPEREAAIAAVEKLGGKVGIDGEAAGQPVWRVDLSATAANDQVVKQLSAFPDLEVLDVSETRITDAALITVGRLSKLREILLDGTAVTDRGLGQLNGLTHLEFLSVLETRVTAQDMDGIRGLIQKHAPPVVSAVLEQGAQTPIGVFPGGPANFRPGAPATDAAPTRQAATLDPGLKSLWLGVIEFRRLNVQDGLRGWKQFADSAVQEQLAGLTSDLWLNEGEAGWSYFFSLALFDVGRPAAKTPVVGFYHPWADVWLLTEWETLPAARIIGVEVLTGEWIRTRGQPPFDARPDWLRREGFRVEQLARATVDNVRAFDSLMYGNESWRKVLRFADHADPVIGDLRRYDREAASVALLMSWMRAGELSQEVDPRKEPQLDAVSRRVWSFIEAGQQGRIQSELKTATATSAPAAELVGELPRQVYHYVAPVYWLADEQRAVAFLVSTINPDFCLVLTLGSSSEGYPLQRIDLISFPAAAEALSRLEKP